MKKKIIQIVKIILEKIKMADNNDNSEQPDGQQAGFSQQNSNNSNPYRYSNPNFQPRQPQQNFNNYQRNSYNNYNHNQQRQNFHYNNNNQKRKFHGNNHFNRYGGNKRQTTSSIEDQFNVKDYYHKSMLEDPWSNKN